MEHSRQPPAAVVAAREHSFGAGDKSPDEFKSLAGIGRGDKVEGGPSLCFKVCN